MTDADFLQLTRVRYSVFSQEVWQVFQEQIIFGLSKITHSRPAPCFFLLHPCWAANNSFFLCHNLPDNDDQSSSPHPLPTLTPVAAQLRRGSRHPQPLQLVAVFPHLTKENSVCAWINLCRRAVLKTKNLQTIGKENLHLNLFVLYLGEKDTVDREIAFCC